MKAPQLAVIVITPDNYHTVRITMRHLRAQTAREQLEIVLVCPSKAQLAADDGMLRLFRWVRLVEHGPLISTDGARAAGVRAATAPVVAFAEEHSFPQPDWAAALIAAHRGPWAGVGPVIGNANPQTLTSWANLIIEYAPWLEPTPAGPAEHIPGHNSSYKRTVLLEYGDRLEAMLDAESVLHWDLRSRGEQLCIEPAAKTFHFNFSRIGSCIPLRFNGGRLFAAARSRQWPWSRRLLYIAGSPLIPLVRLANTDMEFHRPRFLTDADRRAFEGAASEPTA